jgi:hypothetical protein
MNNRPYAYDAYGDCYESFYFIFLMCVPHNKTLLENIGPYYGVSLTVRRNNDIFFNAFVLRICFIIHNHFYQTTIYYLSLSIRFS